MNKDVNETNFKAILGPFRAFLGQNQDFFPGRQGQHGGRWRTISAALGRRFKGGSLRKRALQRWVIVQHGFEAGVIAQNCFAHGGSLRKSALQRGPCAKVIYLQRFQCAKGLAKGGHCSKGLAQGVIAQNSLANRGHCAKRLCKGEDHCAKLL